MKHFQNEKMLKKEERNERECQDDYSNQMTDLSVSNVISKVER